MERIYLKNFMHFFTIKIKSDNLLNEMLDFLNKNLRLHLLIMFVTIQTALNIAICNIRNL